MSNYSFRRTENGKFDVVHGEDCYDGRFSGHQLVNFVAQLEAEGNSVTDSDYWCEATADCIIGVNAPVPNKTT